MHGSVRGRWKHDLAIIGRSEVPVRQRPTLLNLRCRLTVWEKEAKLLHREGLIKLLDTGWHARITPEGIEYLGRRSTTGVAGLPLTAGRLVEERPAPEPEVSATETAGRAARKTRCQGSQIGMRRGQGVLA